MFIVKFCFFGYGNNSELVLLGLLWNGHLREVVPAYPWASGQHEAIFKGCSPWAQLCWPKPQWHRTFPHSSLQMCLFHQSETEWRGYLLSSLMNSDLSLNVYEFFSLYPFCDRNWNWSSLRCHFPVFLKIYWFSTALKDWYNFISVSFSFLLKRKHSRENLITKFLTHACEEIFRQLTKDLRTRQFLEQVTRCKWSAEKWKTGRKRLEGE